MSLEEAIQKESEQFLTLFNRLSDTQWSETALPKAQSHLTACQNQASFIQAKIEVFNAAADKEYKRLVDIKGHGVKHAWYKIRGKLEQNLDEQEKKWLQEFEKCKEEEQHLTVLKEEINSAEKYLQQCQTTYEEYKKTKQTLDKLLKRFFSNVTSYPDEAKAEENLKKEQEYLNTLQRDHYILTHTFELLQKARRALTICRQELDRALNMNTFDLFSNSPFADISVSSHLAKARDASTQAQQLLNEVAYVYPNISHIGDLHIKQDNLVFNILCDNIWTDMNMRKMIHEAMDRIARAYAILADILLEIKGELEKCEIDRDATSNYVKQLAAEHFNARVAIVQNIIDQPPPYSSV